jgi:hypothetical protein
VAPDLLRVSFELDLFLLFYLVFQQKKYQIKQLIKKKKQNKSFTLHLHKKTFLSQNSKITFLNFTFILIPDKAFDLHN